MKKYLKYKIANTSIPSKIIQNSDSNYQLTELQKMNLPSVLTKLKSDLLPQCELALKSQVIDDMENFGNNLKNISDEFNHPILINYCKEISLCVDNFQFDKLIKCLKRFPNIIEHLQVKIK